jgi:hypothetical protein
VYGKIFESTFTGSMYGAGPTVFAVWAYVIATTNIDHEVELNARLVAGCLGAKPEDVEAAIKYLTDPDPASRSPDHGGARLRHLGGFIYSVVNHEKYKGIRNEDERRAYNRDAQARRREKIKAGASGPSVSMCESMTVNDMSAVSAHTEGRVIYTGAPPSPCSNSREATTPTPAAASGGASKRVLGYNPKRVLAAIQAGDLGALVAAFGANARGDEWQRDAAGQTIGTIASIFDWRSHEQKPIREPSGLRSAIEEWRAKPIEWRKGWAAEFAAAIGLEVTPRPSAGARIEKDGQALPGPGGEADLRSEGNGEAAP